MFTIKLNRGENMKIKHSIIAVLAIASTMHAAEDLGEITVTTTGLGQEQSIDDVQASVQVIDQKFIESTSARSVPQLLNEALGVTIKDGGSSSDIHMRGFNEGHTLILVDGLRISGKYGSSDLTNVSLENVERVEIVRGPMSVLYGADAVAGVINVITKKEATKDTMNVSILGGVSDSGQRDTYIASFNGTIGGEKINHNYSIELREKDEFRYDKSSVGTDLRNESRQFLNYGNNIKIDDRQTLSMKLEYARQDDDGVNESRFVPSGVKTFEKEDRYHAGLVHNYTAENFLIDTNMGYSYSDADVDRGSGLETTEYKQFEVNSYLRHYTTDKMTNIFGIGYRHEDIDVSMYTEEPTRDNTNVLFQNDYELSENLTTSIGVRYDYFSDFGSSTNLKGSLVYKYNDFRFRAGYGEAFKAPSFTDMYSHFTRGGGTVDISGNPDLKPEESETQEYAISYSKNNFSFDIVHHRSKLDNLIQSEIYNVDGIPGQPGTIYYYRYENIAKASINGTEVSLNYKFDNGFGVRLGYEYLDTEDETTGERLSNSAKNTFKGNLSYAWNDATIYLNLRDYNDYYTAGSSRTPAESSDYTVVDLKLNYDVKDNLEWFIGVDNIDNEIMPDNMRLFGTPNDPGERFFYTGMNYSF